MMPVGKASDKAKFGPAVEDPDYWHRLLLRACRERPTAAALPPLPSSGASIALMNYRNRSHEPIYRQPASQRTALPHT